MLYNEHSRILAAIFKFDESMAISAEYTAEAPKALRVALAY